MRSRRCAPRTVGDLEAIRSLPPAVARKRGEELLALVASAVAVRGSDRNRGEWHGARRRRRMRSSRSCSRWCGTKRPRSASSPEVLATRRDVEALVFDDRGESAVLRGWRRAVIGEKLLAAK